MLIASSFAGKRLRVGPFAIAWLYGTSLVIGGLSALLITVAFNYLRKHGTEDDAVWLCFDPGTRRVADPNATANPIDVPQIAEPGPLRPKKRP